VRPEDPPQADFLLEIVMDKLQCDVIHTLTIVLGSFLRQGCLNYTILTPKDHIALLIRHPFQNIDSMSF
jgi:hypothetical protein